MLIEGLRFFSLCAPMWTRGEVYAERSSLPDILSPRGLQTINSASTIAIKPACSDRTTLMAEGPEKRSRDGRGISRSVRVARADAFPTSVFLFLRLNIPRNFHHSISLPIRLDPAGVQRLDRFQEIPLSRRYVRPADCHPLQIFQPSAALPREPSSQGISLAMAFVPRGAGRRGCETFIQEA